MAKRLIPGHSLTPLKGNSATEYLESIGATHVVDRAAPLLSSVRAITQVPITYIYDSISSKSTQTAAFEVVAPDGTVILVLPLSTDESKVDKSITVVSTFGSPHDPSQRTLGVQLFKHLTHLLESDDIKVRTKYSPLYDR